MTEPTLVFVEDRDGSPDIIVNFGVYSGRDATDAEVDRLAHALLEEIESVEVLREQRHEFDREAEATVYQVRVTLPQEAEARIGHFASLVEGWAADCIGERRLISP
jgi:hypothetical protein